MPQSAQGALLTLDDSLLLIVDLQERLVPALHDAGDLLERVAMLQTVAHRRIPHVISEHCPARIGASVATVRAYSHDDGGAVIVAKTHFALGREPAALAALEARGRRQIVIAGAEAHVCVLQTALDLKMRDFAVFLVVDAIASRHEIDRSTAIERAIMAGIVPVTTEMVLFEWLGHADHPLFRDVLPLIRDGGRSSKG